MRTTATAAPEGGERAPQVGEPRPHPGGLQADGRGDGLDLLSRLLRLVVLQESADQVRIHGVVFRF